jgi:hypothetical protein
MYPVCFPSLEGFLPSVGRQGQVLPVLAYRGWGGMEPNLTTQPRKRGCLSFYYSREKLFFQSRKWLQIVDTRQMLIKYALCRKHEDSQKVAKKV